MNDDHRARETCVADAWSSNSSSRHLLFNRGEPSRRAVSLR
jgi:hypothetical protein